jgi:hypothetical protein
VSWLIDTNALVHGLTLATRNLGDFRLPVLRVFNPWDEPAGQYDQALTRLEER